ncbi:hypothetical protein ACH47C_18530 [Streptomyces rishiriensis]|uniref:hypothetical protein n=1 Tax=Streptomyces rishiriensis TaxID=68264 RepID=UPI0037914745
MPRLLRLDARNRLPRVRSCTDPLSMGVHPAEEEAGNVSCPGVPAFVPRDTDGALARALADGRFVVLVGESTAGKSRAAFEAAHAGLSDLFLVQPVGRHAVAAAVDAAATAPGPCLLWLDDLERFLGTGGLTRHDLTRLLDASRYGHRVLATMRAEEYARFTRPDHIGPDHLGAETRRAGEEVLRLATRIELSRAWSPAELSRARNHNSDPRIEAALAHADRFGVAEYLAAGPRLLDDWQHAWAPGTRPRAAALVTGAVLARRTGIHRPLPLTVLDRLARPYLAERGGDLLRPEPLAEALSWAVTPLHATSSLLLPVGDSGCVAFDYLIDALPKSVPPPEAVDALVAFATQDEAIDLADAAWGWYLFDQAEAAFRRALDHPEPDRRDYALSMLSYVLAARHGHASALRFTSEEAQERSLRLGPEHPDTLKATMLIAWHTHHSGDTRAAIVLSERTLVTARRVCGDPSFPVLKIRRDLACFREALDPASAAEDFRRLALAYSEFAGAAYRWTLNCRAGHAEALEKSGNGEMARALLHELLNDPDILAESQLRRGIQARQADTAARAGDFTTAIALWRDLLSEAEQDHGLTCGQHLYLRSELASCTGRAGDPEEAVRLLREVVDERTRINTEWDSDAIRFRRRLATWRSPPEFRWSRWRGCWTSPSATRSSGAVTSYRWSRPKWSRPKRGPHRMLSGRALDGAVGLAGTVVDPPDPLQFRREAPAPPGTPTSRRARGRSGARAG